MRLYRVKGTMRETFQREIEAKTPREARRKFMEYVLEGVDWRPEKGIRCEITQLDYKKEVV